MLRWFGWDLVDVLSSKRALSSLTGWWCQVPCAPFVFELSSNYASPRHFPHWWLSFHEDTHNVWAVTHSVFACPSLKERGRWTSLVTHQYFLFAYFFLAATPHVSKRMAQPTLHIHQINVTWKSKTKQFVKEWKHIAWIYPHPVTVTNEGLGWDLTVILGPTRGRSNSHCNVSMPGSLKTY